MGCIEGYVDEDIEGRYGALLHGDETAMGVMNNKITRKSASREIVDATRSIRYVS